MMLKQQMHDEKGMGTTMAKNILVLTGSPRKNGNSDLLAEAFVRGAEAKGHSVTRYNTTAKTIGGCRACDTCWSKGRACTFVDGFTELEPLLEQAETLVFVSPLYWFGMSAQLKAAVDRMYAYSQDFRKVSLKITESLLLTCAATDEMKEFSGEIETYRLIAEYLKWQDRGVLAVPGVQNKGDILKTGALEKAERMGYAL